MTLTEALLILVAAAAKDSEIDRKIAERKKRDTFQTGTFNGRLIPNTDRK